MFQVLSLVVLLGLTLCILPSHKTMAQQFSESDVVYEAARNKIGLIRYCRNIGLLDPAIADQVVTAVETGLLALPSSDTSAREQGDRAQQAGEEGFWEAGRRRDIASIANLFRTTPADLCQEWAGETLRAQAPKPYRMVKTITLAVPKPIQPLPQAEPAPVEPIQADRPPARATAVVRAARSAPPPPLPEKAPVPPTEADLASLPRTLPTGGRLASTGSAASGHMSGMTAMTPSAMPHPSGQAVPLSARLDTEAAEPFPREQTVTAAEPSPGLYDQPRTLLEKGSFNRLGKPERCLMRGCKWPAARERRSWGY